MLKYSLIFVAGLLFACSEAPKTTPAAETTVQTAAAPAPSADNNAAPVPAPPAPASAPAQGTSQPKTAASPKTVVTPKPALTVAPPPPVAPVAPLPVVFSHDLWDKVLQQYVAADGRVNYKALKNNRKDLDDYCKLLADNVPSSSWTRSEQMAYWINAYNAFTIKLITDNYPLSSILKLDGGKTWDVKRIQLGGQSYSLNQIENEILRPRFKDARIHFAINCSAKSCPPLYNHAYTAAQLDGQLDKRTRAFINNPNYNMISAGAVSLSKIFEWYAADFGDVPAFLNRFSDVKVESNAKMKYQEYNWDLSAE